MSKRRISTPEITKSRTGKIRPPSHNGEMLVSFSYKYLDVGNNKFGFTDRDPKYFSSFIERLRDLSSISPTELRRNRGQGLRCHPIQWEDTSESCFGIPGEEQLVGVPFQLQISSNEHGRIHGFFIGSVFYIVWLDPEHLLYPG